MVAAAGPKTRLGAVSVLLVAFLAGLLFGGLRLQPRGHPQGRRGRADEARRAGLQRTDLAVPQPQRRRGQGLPGGPAAAAQEQVLPRRLHAGPNDGKAAQQVPTDFRIEDTVGTEFKPVSSKSLFALSLGGSVPPDGQLPKAETTAANGPIQGSMVLFLVDRAALEDRPLILHIPAPSGPGGQVELDI